MTDILDNLTDSTYHILGYIFPGGLLLLVFSLTGNTFSGLLNDIAVEPSTLNFSILLMMSFIVGFIVANIGTLILFIFFEFPFIKSTSLEMKINELINWLKSIINNNKTNSINEDKRKHYVIMYSFSKNLSASFSLSTIIFILLSLKVMKVNLLLENNIAYVVWILICLSCSVITLGAYFVIKNKNPKNRPLVGPSSRVMK